MLLTRHRWAKVAADEIFRNGDGEKLVSEKVRREIARVARRFIFLPTERDLLLLPLSRALTGGMSFKVASEKCGEEGDLKFSGMTTRKIEE